MLLDKTLFWICSISVGFFLFVQFPAFTATCIALVFAWIAVDTWRNDEG